MFSHVFIGVGDFERAFRFYSAFTEQVGLRLRFCDAGKPWAAWTAALLASREAVDRSYNAALENGGTCDGPPGVRAHYHPDYYGRISATRTGTKSACAAISMWRLLSTICPENR